MTAKWHQKVLHCMATGWHWRDDDHVYVLSNGFWGYPFSSEEFYRCYSNSSRV